MAIRSSDGPINKAFVISPNDSVTLANTTSGIHANASGNANVIFLNSTTGTIIYLNQGSIYPYRITKVFQTGTTCNNLMGLI
jgi:hypothetical protein